MTSNKCPKPGDFSSYYSLDSLKQVSSSICGNIVPQLPGMSNSGLASVLQMGGDGNISAPKGNRIGYTASGELGSFNCHCGIDNDTNNQTGGNKYSPYPINEGQGHVLALHAKPIGQRPVVSTQGSTSSFKKSSQMLDRQFDCLQPFWSEKCD